jgi:isocitrate dehydrogenase
MTASSANSELFWHHVTNLTPGSEQPYASGSTEAVVVDERDIVDERNAVVTYHNPYDNVYHLARIFFARCLAAGITPYVVTKKTVFKWQEPFWVGLALFTTLFCSQNIR